MDTTRIFTLLGKFLVLMVMIDGAIVALGLTIRALIWLVRAVRSAW